MRDLRLSVENQYQLLDWARTKLLMRGEMWSADAEAMAVMDGDVIRAVVVINEKRADGSCNMHIASDHTRLWATRNILGGIFAYVFEYKRMRRAVAAIPEGNIKAQINAIKLGFEFEARLRGAAEDGKDMILLAMHRGECEWLHNQVGTTPERETGEDDNG